MVPMKHTSPSINIQPRREDGSKISGSTRSNHSRDPSISRDYDLDTPLTPHRPHLETIRSEREAFFFPSHLPLLHRTGVGGDEYPDGLLGEEHRRKFHSALCIDTRWEKNTRGSISDPTKYKVGLHRHKLSKSVEIDNFSIRYRNPSDVKTVVQKLQDTSRESLHKVQKYLNRRYRGKPIKQSASRKSSVTSYTTIPALMGGLHGFNTNLNNNLLNPDRRASESSCSTHTLEGFATLPTVPPPYQQAQALPQIPVSPFPAKLPSKKVPDRQSIHPRPRLPTFVNSDFSSLPGEPQNDIVSSGIQISQMGNGFQTYNSGNKNNSNKNMHANGPTNIFPSSEFPSLVSKNQNGNSQTGGNFHSGSPKSNNLGSSLSPDSAWQAGGVGGFGSNKKRQRPSLPKPPTNGVSDSAQQFNDLIEIHG